MKRGVSLGPRVGLGGPVPQQLEVLESRPPRLNTREFPPEGPLDHVPTRLPPPLAQRPPLLPTRVCGRLGRTPVSGPVTAQTHVLSSPEPEEAAVTGSSPSYGRTRGGRFRLTPRRIRYGRPDDG